MHKSKLAGFIIDCNTDDLHEAASFWGAALGMETRKFSGEEGEKYVKLQDPQENLHVEVQSVSHESRVHLDIETDDINQEVERLKKLGAVKVGEAGTWCVMQAPTGQKFCVVREASPNFNDDANEWS